MARSDNANAIMNMQEVERLIGFRNDSGVNPIAIIRTLVPQAFLSFQVKSRQQFVRRYRWYTLDGRPFPKGFDPNVVERILYFRYQIICFEHDGKFWTLPFALNGNIDSYGRYTVVTPLAWNGKVEVYDGDGKPVQEYDKKTKQFKDHWICDMRYAPSYDVDDIEPEYINPNDPSERFERCVILRDYTNAVAQYGYCRYYLNNLYDNLLAETLGLIEHNLVASAKLYTFRIQDEGQRDKIMQQIGDIRDTILKGGSIFLPITSPVEIDELFASAKLDTQNLFESFASINNLKENLMGIENNGVFKKKERELVGEMEKEASQADLVTQDGLEQRQQFCDIMNAMYGTNLAVEVSKPLENEDLNDYNDNIQGAENYGET